ncbi:hypothetical protein BDK51DRAFT_50623 [Blyttiomyces helicus]|uniref:Uncharacterized protein n=1 Tax=Blyttiomyces helicus TaxID=388810 RepID=A0A4P9WG14_9FUNG|nr:hypothetical protein BDK51DRAFT_50623 [Blyttiomyces helicus]|eukprot:RKO91741.1 hypothetical protein BDK51DRAFT_50623 [Blyttiomyces helicus]
MSASRPTERARPNPLSAPSSAIPTSCTTPYLRTRSPSLRSLISLADVAASAAGVLFLDHVGLCKTLRQALEAHPDDRADLPGNHRRLALDDLLRPPCISFRLSGLRDCGSRLQTTPFGGSEGISIVCVDLHQCGRILDVHTPPIHRILWAFDYLRNSQSHFHFLIPTQIRHNHTETYPARLIILYYLFCGTYGGIPTNSPPAAIVPDQHSVGKDDGWNETAGIGQPDLTNGKWRVGNHSRRIRLGKGNPYFF